MEDAADGCREDAADGSGRPPDAAGVDAVPGDPGLDEIRQAAARIAGLVDRTPTLRARELSERTGSPVHLKAESLQTTGSFKVRGAANTVLSLSAEERERGVVACSSGNHGLAVAWVARQVGIPATICLPEWVDPTKSTRIRQQGARALIAGATYDEAEAEADRRCREEGLTYVHPFDDPRVIAGQGTLGLEIAEDVPEVETVLVPLSGGGLLSGVGLALEAARPGIRLVAVAARRAAVMARSLDAGRPLELAEEETLATALSGGIGLDNRHTFRLVRRLADRVVEVTEEQIAAAMLFAAREHGLVVEGGGAVALGAMLAGTAGITGPAAVVLSGGNVSLEVLARVAGGPA